MTIVADETALAAAHRVADALGDEAVAVYVVGSVSLDAFEPVRSDLDMVAVFDHLERPAIDAIVARVLDVDLAPARQLELVVYAGGEIVLNLNAPEPLRVEYETAEDEWFWFVLDRAIAQANAIALSGPPWSELFPRVTRDEALPALEASLAWHEEHEPRGPNTALNALRTRCWLETDRWVSKPEALRWFLQDTRNALGRER
jgi:predicted nucleotidyltransferase